MSQAAGFFTNNGPGGFVQTLTGNTGPAVPPLAGNINVVGDGTTITVAGNAGTHTLTISTTGAVADSFVTDSGTATPSAGVLNIIAGLSTFNCGATVEFTGSGNTVELSVTGGISQSTLIGALCGQHNSTGENNTGLGYGALNSGGPGLTGSQNTGVGSSCLFDLQAGEGNCAFGFEAIRNGIPGNFNIAIGNLAAFNWTGGESDNIIISNPGVASEANTIRIGTTGSGDQEQNKCFIAGIGGVNVGSTATVVTEAGDQLGTAVITAGSGISVTPGANTITIAATGGGAKPAFGAYLNTSLANVTGDGTTYVPIVFDTTSFDVTSNYNAGTGVFTVPTTGIYFFQSTITLSGVGAAHINANFTLEWQIPVTNLIFEIANPFAINAFTGLTSLSGSATVHLAAGIQVFMNIQVSGGTKTVGILGFDAGQYFSQFSGYLVG